MNNFFIGTTIFVSLSVMLLGLFTGNLVFLLVALYQILLGIFIGTVANDS